MDAPPFNPNTHCEKCRQAYSIRVDPVARWATTMCACGCLIEYLGDSRPLFEALSKCKNGHATFVPSRAYKRMTDTDKFQNELIHRAERAFGAKR